MVLGAVFRSSRGDLADVVALVGRIKEAEKLVDKMALVEHMRLVHQGKPSILEGEVASTVLHFRATP
jgi:hypothetical protein